MSEPLSNAAVTHSDAASPLSAPEEQLTRYPAGSIREIWALSYPLMLSALSGTLMVFLDRLILARYQTQAMNAAADAGMVFFTCIFVALGIAGIAEVLVGQYNGAKQHRKIGAPVWAMLWFSVMTILPFWGIGLWGSEWLIPDRMLYHGTPYLKCLMFFAPLFPMVAALSAFYIGRGKVATVTLTVAAGNLINLILDVVLVFGIEGLVPEMGTFGAALGTGLAQLAMVVILFALFFQKKHRKKFNTDVWRMDWSAFKQCFKIGLPNSMGHLAAISAWTYIMHLMADKSFEHMTVFTVAQSAWILFSFIADGSSKAVSSVAANFIGAKKQDKIPSMLQSAIILQLIYAVCMTVVTLVGSDFIIQRFLTEAMSVESHDIIVTALKSGLIWVCIALFFDGIIWSIAGVLTAAGDTKFIMWASAVGTWLFGVAPMIVLVIDHENAGPARAMVVLAFYTGVLSLCFYARYKSNVWQKGAFYVKD